MGFLNNGITGHRGDPQHFPQNTLAGFEAAIKMGCDWVETDIRLTADGRVVLSHDADTWSEGDKALEIRKSKYEDLRKLNMAARFNMIHCDRTPRVDTIPSLEETLELFRSQDQVRLSLQPKAPGTVEAAAKIIRDMKFPAEMLGFNDANLGYMISGKEKFPEATVFYDRNYGENMLDALMEDIAVALRFKFKYIVVYERVLTEEAVLRILDAGLLPGVWNINNPGEMDRFIDMGVKRFYTDFPAVMMKKLGIAK